MTINLKINKILFLTSFALLGLSCTPLFSMEDSNKCDNQKDNFDRLSALPEEIQQKILGQLDAKSLVQISETNKYFHNQADDENLWKGLCRQDGIQAEPDKSVKISYISQRPSIERSLKELKEIFNREEPLNLKSNYFINDLVGMIDKNEPVAKIYEQITRPGFLLFLRGTFEGQLIKFISTPGQYELNEELYSAALRKAGIRILPQVDFYDSYRAAYEKKFLALAILIPTISSPLMKIAFQQNLLNITKKQKQSYEPLLGHTRENLTLTPQLHPYTNAN